MLKRKFFAVALPIIAGATIVGAGFSAWVFHEQSYVEKTQGIGVSVTDKVSADGIKLDIKYTNDKNASQSVSNLTKIELVLDQGFKEATGNEENGIYFKVGETTATDILKSIEVSVNNETATDTIGELQKAGYKVKLETQIQFHTTLLKWVELKTNTWTTFNKLTKDSSAGVANYDVYKQTQEITAGSDTSVGAFNFLSTAETGVTSATNNFYENNQMFKYHASTSGTSMIKKPTTSTEYDVLKADFTQLGASTNVIQLSFKLKIFDAKDVEVVATK